MILTRTGTAQYLSSEAESALAKFPKLNYEKCSFSGLDRMGVLCYDLNVALKGTSAHGPAERAAGWCKAEGRMYAAIPEQRPERGFPE